MKRETRWYRLKPRVIVNIKKLKEICEEGAYKGVFLNYDGIEAGKNVSVNEGIITVAFGTAFGGRPVHEWRFHYKYKVHKDGVKASLTHWKLEEWHTESPNTLGFALFFPEAVRPFWTSIGEARAMAHEKAVSVLHKLSNARRVRTKFGWLWDFQLEEVKGWIKSRLKVVHYRCRNCGQHAYATRFRGICSRCLSSNVEVTDVTLEDLKILETK